MENRKKRALIVGMARSGIAAAKLLLLRGAEVWVCDTKKREDFNGALDELEKGCILEALRRHRGNMGKAARELGLPDRIMALRMKKYGLNYKEFRSTGERT